MSDDQAARRRTRRTRRTLFVFTREGLLHRGRSERGGQPRGKDQTSAASVPSAASSSLGASGQASHGLAAKTACEPIESRLKGGWGVSVGYWVGSSSIRRGAAARKSSRRKRDNAHESASKTPDSSIVATIAIIVERGDSGPVVARTTCVFAAKSGDWSFTCGK